MKTPTAKKILRKRVLVKLVKQEKTAGGLMLSVEAEEEAANVLQIGDEVTKVKKGDRVAFKTYSKDQIIDGENLYTFIEEDNILAIL